MEGSPLSPEQQQALEDARERASSFSGAAKVASFNGWSFALFAGLSILFGFLSLPGLLVGVGLAVVARNEFAGRDLILDFDPSGFRLLWKNQLGLLAIIFAYCLWAIGQAQAGPSPALQELDTTLGEGISELIQSVTILVYAVVIVLSGIYQGLNALYYFRRVGRLEEYLEETPAWVLDLHRSLREQ